MVSKYFDNNSQLKTKISIWRKTNAYTVEKVRIKPHLEPQDTKELSKCVCVCRYGHAGIYVCVYIMSHYKHINAMVCVYYTHKKNIKQKDMQ